MKTFGSRLREERQRLSLNQEELANYGGVKRGAQINYEKDERVPDANYMSSIANIGVDIHYVLTGERITRKEAKEQGKFKPDPYVAMAIATAALEDDDHRPLTQPLNKEEWELIQRYRNASLEIKFKVIQSLMEVDMSDKAPNDKPVSTKKGNKPIIVTGNGNRTAGRDYNEHPSKKK